MATPGGPLEICFSFDTTISMTDYVKQVKARLQDMIQRLKSDIPGIKLALFAHGDYYQPEYRNKCSYVTKHIDLTDDVVELCKFIRSATNTKGGDWDECYELVLREAKEQLSWAPGSNKVLVMIGDATPHAADNPVNKDKIDWRVEAKELLDKGIRTYGVYCDTSISGKRDLKFYKELANIGNGDYLTLNNFDSIFDFMMAICYREKDEGMLHAYEREVRSRGGEAARDVKHMFTTLKKSVSNASTSSMAAAPSVSKVAVHKETPKAAKQSTAKTVSPRKAKIKGAKTTRTTKTGAKAKVMPKRKTGPASMMATREKEVSVKTNKPAANKGQYKCRLRRERVPETNFGLREYHWSPWKPVLSARKLGDEWEKRPGQSGFRIKSIFKGKAKRRTLYEFAVQKKRFSKKVVVYAKMSLYYPLCVTWEDHLLNSKCLRSQINNILDCNLTIHLRRLVLGRKRTSTISDQLKIYDYAWEINSETGKSRAVTKTGEIMSYEMDMDT